MNCLLDMLRYLDMGSPLNCSLDSSYPHCIVKEKTSFRGNNNQMDRKLVRSSSRGSNCLQGMTEETYSKQGSSSLRDNRRTMNYHCLDSSFLLDME